MEEVVFLVLDAVFGGVILWVAARLTSVDLSLGKTVIAAGVAAVVALIPALGWVLSLVALFTLLKKFSGASIWPDIVLMVIVSRLVSFVAVMAFAGL